MPDTIHWHVGATVASAVHCNSAALRIALLRVCIALHQRHSRSLTNSPAIRTFAGPTRYPLLPLRLLWLSAALARHLPFADLTRCSLTPINPRSGALSRLTPPHLIRAHRQTQSGWLSFTASSDSTNAHRAYHGPARFLSRGADANPSLTG